MKKITALLSSLVMLLSLTACGASEKGIEGSAPTQEPIVFADPALESMICGALGKPMGSITQAEAEAVTRLDLSFDWQRYLSEEMQITDIHGLEYFTSLESLDLSYHAITDISPLAGLNQLTLLALSENPIADVTPLAGLKNLKALVLTGCAAQDYSALSNLTALECLWLNNSAIADLMPLAALTSLKRLYLSGCQVRYAPLTEIYQNLEARDFTIAATLAEFGFHMDGAQAIYDGEQVSVRINHTEWGYPGEDWIQNCVRTVFGQNGYKVDIGYYPEHDAYVIQANKDGAFVLNYLYFVADGSFSVDNESRSSAEAHVRAIFPDVADKDLLLEPVRFHIAALADAFDMTAAELYELPYAPQTPAGTDGGADGETPFAKLGFSFDEAAVCCVYEERDPHYASVAIHRPEWGAFNGDWNIEFIDTDVNGYGLRITYHESEGKYHISLEKGGENCSYLFYPATDEKGGEEPDLDTTHRMFNNAFGTKEKELYYVPLEYFRQFVQTRFGMSIDELYALQRD